MSASLPDRKDGPPGGGFEPAQWGNATRVSPLVGNTIGVSFETASGTVRLLLSVESAKQAMRSLLHEIRARPFLEVVTPGEAAALEACWREDESGDSSEILGRALAKKYGVRWLEEEDLVNVDRSDVGPKT